MLDDAKVVHGVGKFLFSCGREPRAQLAGERCLDVSGRSGRLADRAALASRAVATERHLIARERRRVNVKSRSGDHAQERSGAHSHRKGKESIADERDRSDKEQRSAPR